MKKKEMIELLEQRIDQMENEHMQLTRELARLQGRLDTFESRLPDEESIEEEQITFRTKNLVICN